MINPIGGCPTHPIIHFAVADVDAAYGAYAAAEDNIFNNANSGNNNANHANYYDSKQGIVRNYCEKPYLADPV